MDKRILDLVGDFSQWKGDSYKLAALVAEQQKEIDRQKLIDAGHEAAAEVI
jgi:hypothetical protein